MLRIALLAALAVTCFAQNAEEIFNRPPAEVDKALRDRVMEFYGYHISGQFRKAEAMVAEDTKDFFYTANKPAYTKCEIRQVKYLDDFKQAKVTMLCGMYVMMPGFTDKPLDVPFGSTWKIEGGKWMWFVSEEARRASPFGKMKPGPPSSGSAPGAGIPAIPTSPDFLRDLVKAEPQTIELKRGGTAEVTLANTAPGAITLEIAGKIEGVEAKLDNTALKPHDKAILTVTAGDTAASGSLRILALPIQQTIAIQVTVK